MKILITNSTLIQYTGTETYIHDLALELKKRGHSVGIFTAYSKNRVQDLLDQEIEVVSSLEKLSFTPDIIHGHHHFETVSALNFFKDTPSIFVSHSPFSFLDNAPKSCRILRYFGVDRWCRQRTAKELDKSEEEVGFLNNFVNTRRFKQREAPLPKSPKKALVFSNYASRTNYLPILQNVCRRKNIQLDTIGSYSKGIHTAPEEILKNYDIIFCKAKAAIEALAVGAHVILCDFTGFGGVVTTENFTTYRENNFAWNILSLPILEKDVADAIDQYDPVECQKTSELIHRHSSLESFTDKLLDLYVDVLQEHCANKHNMPFSHHKISAVYRLKRIRSITARRYPLLKRGYKIIENLIKKGLLKKRPTYDWIDM